MAFPVFREASTFFSRSYHSCNFKSEAEMHAPVLVLSSDDALLFNRCESILQPGSKCAVRIEKNKSKTRHKRKKSNPTTKNNVVYQCHFCSHRNLMRGTPKGYVKEICPPKAKPTLKLETAKFSVDKCPSSAKATTNTAEVNKVDIVDLPTVDGQNLETSSPATPLPTTFLSLLDSKRRKRNRSGAKKVAEPETSFTAGDEEKSKQVSSKRRKKSWTSLKEIAQSGGNDIGSNFTNLTIPFFV
ncbi:hypothetical protein DH2020_014749 [Rehmannia glutinosa]|uniref:Uncharacterized protein n=1 Tax=Rehmannia glutinosa TaxID=99300 RepID=A0ABR0X0M7_REHGL